MLLILSKQALVIVGEATSVRDTTYDDTNYMYMYDQKQSIAPTVQMPRW